MFIQMHRCLYGVGMLEAAPKHKNELNIGPLEAPPNHLLLRHCLNVLEDRDSPQNLPVLEDVILADTKKRKGGSRGCHDTQSSQNGLQRACQQHSSSAAHGTWCR